MKRMFRTEAVIYLPMGETETLIEAEDRFLDLADNIGLDVFAYRDPELLTFDIPFGEKNDVAEGKQIS